MNIKSLIIFWSITGNTKKVADAIRRGMEKAGINPIVKTVEEATCENLFDYDVVCLGSPSHYFLPAEPVLHFIREKMKEYGKDGAIKPCAPKLSGKCGIIFCTYSGPHTGVDEAIPAGKCMQQFLAHLGFEVKAEWYVIGEFHGNELLSTKGKLGNIKGRPNEHDLAKVEADTEKLVKQLLPKAPH